MAFPTTSLTLTYLDNDLDTVANARSQIHDMGLAVNDMIDSINDADGVAVLDSGGALPNTVLPNSLISSSGNDITLVPASEKVAIENIINLNPRTVAQLTALTGVEGDVAYCSNGDAGSKCIAVYNGTNWVVVSLGSTISAT